MRDCPRPEHRGVPRALAPDAREPGSIRCAPEIPTHKWNRDGTRDVNQGRGEGSGGARRFGAGVAVRAQLARIAGRSRLL